MKLAQMLCWDEVTVGFVILCVFDQRDLGTKRLLVLKFYVCLTSAEHM